MKLETTSSETLATDVEALTNQFCEVVDGLLDDGVHPYLVTEAVLLALLPLALEITRASTIEAALLALAGKFDGNDLRRSH